MSTTLPHQSRRGTRLRRVAGAVLALILVGVVASPVAADQTDKTERSKRADTEALGSMSAVADQIGARELWEQGITGAGVNVAIVDTGVADVPALSGPDKVVAMVDLSAESGVSEALFADTYGHGTHMAGIIAGRSPGAVPADPGDDEFLGVAPDAGIVSVKVADNSGAADISQVIAGVDWVIDHAEDLDIGVLNLSYSSGSTLPYETDPLSYAVERAWNAGIVVVTAAGNDGRGAQDLASPADNPYMIAVTAAEAKRDGSGVRFHSPSWATKGDATRPPDIAAPGTSIISLRAPLSRVDLEYPEGYVDEQLFKGSGSSQAAAVVSGAAALLLQDRPDLTPDQVKALLRDTAQTMTPRAERISGQGFIDVGAAVAAPATDTVQDWPASDGSGSLEAARGDVHMMIDGVPLVGEYTVLGVRWDGVRWDGVRWSGGEWDGVRWSDGDWMGVRWSNSTWTGQAWSGSAWNGVRWSGVRWSDAEWSSSSWTGTRWSGVRWSGAEWTGVRWDGTRWSGTRWSGTRWSQVGWS